MSRYLGDTGFPQHLLPPEFLFSQTGGYQLHYSQPSNTTYPREKSLPTYQEEMTGGRQSPVSSSTARDEQPTTSRGYVLPRRYQTYESPMLMSWRQDSGGRTSLYPSGHGTTQGAANLNGNSTYGRYGDTMPSYTVSPAAPPSTSTGEGRHEANTSHRESSDSPTDLQRYKYNIRDDLNIHTVRRRLNFD